MTAAEHVTSTGAGVTHLIETDSTVKTREMVALGLWHIFTLHFFVWFERSFADCVDAFDEIFKLFVGYSFHLLTLNDW